MADPISNPFSILTFIAAPAVLTNASSVLALGTSNRFARNIDRARFLIKELQIGKADPKSPDALYRVQLQLAESRAALLVRAMTCFYFAVGCFAAGSLLSLLGAILASTEHSHLLKPVLLLALIAGTAGLGGLIAGGALLVTETRLALRSIRDEANFFRAHFPESES